MNKPDTRMAYGAVCTWFGPIQEVGSLPRHVRGPTIAALPCCPHCQNMLFEMPTQEEWWRSVDKFEAAGAAGYRKMLEWQREQKKCFPNTSELVTAYKAATGIEVSL